MTVWVVEFTLYGRREVRQFLELEMAQDFTASIDAAGERIVLYASSL